MGSKLSPTLNFGIILSSPMLVFGAKIRVACFLIALRARNCLHHYSSGRTQTIFSRSQHVIGYHFSLKSLVGWRRPSQGHMDPEMSPKGDRSVS